MFSKHECGNKKNFCGTQSASASSTVGEASPGFQEVTWWRWTGAEIKEGEELKMREERTGYRQSDLSALSTEGKCVM